MGDFNVRSFVDPDLSNSKCRDLLDFISFSGLTQTNNTRNIDNVLLDLVLVRDVSCKVEHSGEPLTREDVYHPSLLTKSKRVCTKTQKLPRNNAQIRV